MKLGVLLTFDHRLLSVAAIIDVFETANRFYADEGLKEPFEIELLQFHESDSAYTDYNAKIPSLKEKYDLLLIPAFKQDSVPGCLNDNAKWISWLNEQYDRGAAIASFCTGAFLLAATGLLNGRPATTHINAETAFKKAFPLVKVQAEAVVTEHDRIYTSGGATNSFHLMMLLLEVYCSKETAIRAAKVFSVDMDRNRQKLLRDICAGG
jgi:transcriptional regulator GlxA family with amidase domain